MARTLQLLAARPLALSTRVPETAEPPAEPRTGARPVVAARWPGSAVAGQGDDPVYPVAGGPQPAAPQVQRASVAPLAGREGPVVRPAPPGSATTVAAATVPAGPLPVTAPQAPPLGDRPPGPHTPPEVRVPVVRPQAGTSGARTAAPVQRDVSDASAAAPAPAPFKGAPPRTGARPHGRSRSASTSSVAARGTSAAVRGTATATGTATDRRAESPQDPGIDLDALARRLLDPMARLLRTELRRGRERTGRPYDGRR
ncbi:hypothetical protein [Streptomyces beihaiensis]|uniref:Syndecan 1 n=1 Tax=Streptomyces beihaiensis TaxID=2984495 RepID=A0ABT3TR94_9ACTN|nr:hypothetical protein [Streptomyces beihaiensis]MCX3059546.1 hypothetical protein [Streptomyces beihaiensis]